MHGDVRPTVAHRGFELFDEKTLAADFAEGRGQQPVAAGRHADNLDDEARMRLLQPCGDELGLPECEPTLTRCNAEVGDGHNVCMYLRIDDTCRRLMSIRSGTSRNRI